MKHLCIQKKFCAYKFLFSKKTLHKGNLKLKKLTVEGATKDSQILVGESLANLESYIPEGVGKRIIITDENVHALYKDKFPAWETIIVGTGEKAKTLETAGYIYNRLIELEADRTSYIVGIGGGIVCDVTGFIASTYMRGIGFGFVSTTLLAQVDASVGGKNGVNFEGFKNMVGVFNQPDFVICDLATLKTLPTNDLLCGFAEILKHGAIKSEDHFRDLEENWEKMVNLDLEALERLVYDSVAIKAAVVNADEREKGERKKLNFGHTIGHAIEKTTGRNHGESVSAGIVAASRLSVQEGLITQNLFDRIIALLEKLGLPVKLDIDKEKVIDALKKDKKRAGEKINFVLLQELGDAVVMDFAIPDIASLVNELGWG